MTVPQIPECSVARTPDGALLLTHRGSGQAAIAKDTAEDPVIQGVILRCLAAYSWAARPVELPIPAGDLTALGLPRETGGAE